MKEILITLISCLVIYEIVEHILLPLFYTIRYRGRKSAYGPSGMIGKRCVVKQWTGNRGKVWVGGELWNAIGNSLLMPGDEGLIQGIDNLTLQVLPLGETVVEPSLLSEKIPGVVFGSTWFLILPPK